MSQPPEVSEAFSIEDFVGHLGQLGSSPMQQDNEDYATPPGQQLTLLDMAALAQYDEPPHAGMQGKQPVDSQLHPAGTHEPSQMPPILEIYSMAMTTHPWQPTSLKQGVLLV